MGSSLSCPLTTFQLERPASPTKAQIKGNVEASPICIGAWPWGDKATFGYRPEERAYLDQVWDICFQNGINFIDTGQGYGDGLSLIITGETARKYPRDQVVVQTKFWVPPDADAFAGSKAQAITGKNEA